MAWHLQIHRTDQAAGLLADLSYNVTQAGMAVRFDSLIHFNHLFGSFMGVSPRLFRTARLQQSSRGAAEKSGFSASYG